jgi:hypothetical protein
MLQLVGFNLKARISNHVLLKAFMQNVVKLAPPNKALHTPWCHFIFSL